ncbi:hypothetical protein OIU84_010499 [Salix udensis]|uniref:Uncharacterized protein n=1 Tax=Salix udensis TaxID=889485 RepID=A0AAD6NVU4_9ROSI|nr:hypothetical protein OIU84_010499 [Salix udensis]
MGVALHGGLLQPCLQWLPLPRSCPNQAPFRCVARIGNRATCVSLFDYRFRMTRLTFSMSRFKDFGNHNARSMHSSPVYRKLNGGFGHVYGDGVRVHREFNAASNGTLSVLASKSRL